MQRLCWGGSCEQKESSHPRLRIKGTSGPNQGPNSTIAGPGGPVRQCGTAPTLLGYRTDSRCPANSGRLRSRRHSPFVPGSPERTSGSQRILGAEHRTDDRLLPDLSKPRPDFATACGKISCRQKSATSCGKIGGGRVTALVDFLGPPRCPHGTSQGPRSPPLVSTLAVATVLDINGCPSTGQSQCEMDSQVLCWTRILMAVTRSPSMRLAALEGLRFPSRPGCSRGAGRTELISY